jgi:hypothetical protein
MGRPTGRPVGRPRKAPAPVPTGRPRGRPRRVPPPSAPPSSGPLDPPPALPVWREIPSAADGDPAEASDGDQRDTIAVRYFGLGERWTAEVTLGPVTHELGSFTTASKAMNAAMKFYYEQRPAAKRRQYE